MPVIRRIVASTSSTLFQQHLHACDVLAKELQRLLNRDARIFQASQVRDGLAAHGICTPNYGPITVDRATGRIDGQLDELTFPVVVNPKRAPAAKTPTVPTTVQTWSRNTP
jgi:hypothetical protein